jgi:hypothetical protein
VEARKVGWGGKAGKGTRHADARRAPNDERISRQDG